MARYLVTGGAGFIGSNIALELAAAGERVRAFDDLSTGDWVNLAGSSVECVTGDVRDASSVAAALRGVEVVFHQAALVSVPDSIQRPLDTEQINVVGTLNVLEAARAAGVKRVILAASAAAYGAAPAQPQREDMPPDPLSPYALSKLAAEYHLRLYSRLYGLETLSLRYFNVFGPGQLPEGSYAAAIPRFAWAALRGDPINVFGDGLQTRDFCFVSNVVSANLLAAGSTRKLAGEVVNIASGRSITLLEVVTALEQRLSRKLRVDHTDARAGDVRFSSASIEAARELLGYQPGVSFEQGLEPTLEYLRALSKKRGCRA